MKFNTFKKIGSSLLILALAFTLALPAVAKDHTEKDKDDRKSEKSEDLKEYSKKHAGQRLIVVKGELTAVSSRILPAQLTVKVTKSSPSLIKAAETVTIQVDAKTKFVRQHFGKSTITELSVGDLVQISGRLRADGTVEARLVKNESIVSTWRTGTIGSINTTTQSLVLIGSKPDGITVGINSDTKITSKNGSKLVFTDLLVGAKIGVTGILNTTNKTMVAEKVRVDMVKPTSLTANFQGTLQSASSSTIPTILTIKATSGERPMNVPHNIVMVKIDSTTVLQSNDGSVTTLGLMRLGDKLSIQGNVGADGQVTATTIKNKSILSSL